MGPSELSFQIFTSVDTDVRRDHAFNFLMVYHDHFAKVRSQVRVPEEFFLLITEATDKTIKIEESHSTKRTGVHQQQMGLLVLNASLLRYHS